MYFLGIDMVRDQAEEALIQEATILQNCKEKLSHLHYRVLEQVSISGYMFNEIRAYSNISSFLHSAAQLIFQSFVLQLRENRNSQHELELDLKSKESALDIDAKCHQLTNYSSNVNYYMGIEKYDQT